MTEILIVLAVLTVILAAVFVLFRFWASHAAPEVPGAVAILFGILGGIGSLILGTPPPRARGGTAGQQVMNSVAGQFAEGISMVFLLMGLGLTALFCGAMGLGILAGSRRRQRRTGGPT